MESSSLYRVGSLRRNGSSMWRNTGEDVFSRSSRDDDDEEALKWAALEKLPTYDRIRKGIMLTGMTGEYQEVDVNKLGFQERKNLVERLIRVAEEDNEKFLWKLKGRMDRLALLTSLLSSVCIHIYVKKSCSLLVERLVLIGFFWIWNDVFVKSRDCKSDD